MAALVAGFLLVVATAPSLEGALGSDLPAFLTAGTLVLEGRGEQLWDWETQRQIQARIEGAGATWLPFVYPAPVAAVYAPLAALPLRWAHALHFAAMLAALLGAVRLIGHRVAFARREWLALLCVAGSFMPMFRSLTGGQNPPLTLLLLAACWAAIGARRVQGAGVAAGLLLYKPQFGVPLIGLILLWDWRAACVAAGVALSLYGVGACVAGWGWGPAWAAGLLEYQRLDQDANGANAIGYLGFLEALLGHGSPLALGLGATLSAGTAAFLAWAWLTDRGTPDQRMALTTVGLVVIDPHAMRYEAALAVLPVIVWIADGGARPLALALGTWLAGFLFFVSGSLPAHPLGVGMAALFGLWAFRIVRQPSQAV